MKFPHCFLSAFCLHFVSCLFTFLTAICLQFLFTGRPPEVDALFRNRVKIPHTFVIHTYTKPTQCHYCKKMLVGVFKQVCLHFKVSCLFTIWNQLFVYNYYRVFNAKIVDIMPTKSVLKRYLKIAPGKSYR